MKKSFEEWLKENPPKCKKCNTILEMGYQHYGVTFHKLIDVDHERIKGVYCTECHEIAEQELKDSRFVEEYKDNKIYLKNGQYFPYWCSNYTFPTIEDCRLRIDHNHMSIVDLVMYSALRRGDINW